MAQRTLKGRVAIVGIGETHYYKHGQSPDAEFKLALQAVLRACADAGLDPRHIDGFASYGDDRSEATRLASALGLPIDADGRVLDRAGRVVVGLYACGNDAASVMRGTYPGPGTTLGPAFVFAWRAALFAARRAASARAHPIEEKP